MEFKAIILLIFVISSVSCYIELDKNNNNSSILEKESEITTTTSTISPNSADKSFLPYPKNKKAIRNPKFGFNLPGNFPLIPGLTDATSTPYPNYSNYLGDSGTTGNDATKLVDPGGIGIATTLALVKGGVLGGLTAIKAAVLPPLFIGAVIVFLVAGAAFFACNVINCGNLMSSGSSAFTNFFNRNGIEPSPYYGGVGYDPYYYENQIQPVYQALDEGYKKYEENKSMQQ